MRYANKWLIKEKKYKNKALFDEHCLIYSWDPIREIKKQMSQNDLDISK